MKPLEVVVRGLPTPERSLTLEPLVITPSQLRESHRADSSKALEIAVQGEASDLPARWLSQVERCAPLTHFLLARLPRKERRRLVPRLHGRDVEQERAYCVAPLVLQVIELFDGQ